MPPVGAALAAVTTAVTSAVIAGGAAVGLGAVASVVAYNAFVQMAVGVALSAISRALAPKPGTHPPVQGTKVQIGVGENQPQSFILGRACTAGDLLYVGSYGKVNDTPNSYLVQVIEISDAPARLRRVWVNGEWVTLGATEGTDNAGHKIGFPVEEYRGKAKGLDHLWVRYYDGTQITADPSLIEHFGDDPDERWTSDMIGRGMAYAIVTARFSPEIHRQKPDCRFEVEATHYDPRKDSSAGGSGGQRWGNHSTWEPTTNLAVLAYNVLRGFREPITNNFWWGGQDILERDLPAASWFAAMNECDREIARIGGGTEPQYHGGIEVRVDTEPAAVLEELMKGCQGNLAECAGVWTMTAGPPSAPVYAFTDGDVITTSPDEFQPFPGLDQAYNGIAAQYSRPADGWETRDAPVRTISTYLAEDGGRRQIASLQFPAVFSGTQVQRLMASALKDQRRFRRHSLVLPPEARKLGLMDEVSWTSERNGYESKRFCIDAIEDLSDGCAAVMLRERDPSDYDWDSTDELPEVINPGKRPPLVPQVGSFGVEAAVVKDSTGAARRPAIRLFWQDTENVTAVRYRVRLAADGGHVPGNSQGSGGEGGSVALTFTAGGNVLLFGGSTLGYIEFADEDALELWITEGIVNAEDYEVQAIFVPVSGRIWSEWMPVTTLDVRITEPDLATEVTDKINVALDNANTAGEQATAAYNKSLEVEATVGALSTETIEAAEELAAALAAYDAEAIAELTGVAIAGLRRGWASDPSFHKWAGGIPTQWSGAGLASFAVQDTDGSLSSTAIPPHYYSSLWANVPSGSGILSLSATSDVAGEIPGADPSLEYLVAAALLFIPSGSVSGARLRVEWWDGSAWIRGHALGQTNSAGTFADWGFAVSALRRQSKEVIWQKPAGTMSKVRLWCDIKQATPTTAVAVRIDYLDLRPPSAAEIEAHKANEYADAAIDAYDLTITGPGGAIAASFNTLTANYQAADATIQTSVTAVANDVGAQASRLTTIEASHNDANMVRNPQFADGVRAAGAAPNAWTNWSSEFSVVAKTPTLVTFAALLNAPTPFVAQVAATSNQAQATAFERQPVKPGDIIAVKFKAAGSGTSPSFSFAAIATFQGADEETIGASHARTVTINSSAWVTTDFADFVAPDGAATMRLYIRRVAGGTPHAGFFTAVEARFVDGASRALISEAAVAAADANMAIATLNTAVSAEFSSYSAWIDASATAVATAESAQTAYVIRTIGGSFGIYGWDDKDGTDAAIRLDARYVIAPGTISAGELVVTDLGYNLVPDNQLQSETAWSGAADDFTIIKDTTASADSAGEIKWTHSAGSGTVVSRGKTFPVRNDQVLTCSAQIARGGTGTIECGARLRFSAKDGGFISNGYVLSLDNSLSGIQSDTVVLSVPTGAFSAAWEWFVEKGGTDVSVRFFSPSVIRKVEGTTLITPHSVTANEAFFESLAALNIQVVRADIVDAAVDTLQIRGNAVTVPIFAERNTSLVSTESYATVLSVNVPMTMAGTIVVNGVMRMDTVSAPTEDTTGPSADVRVLIDGSVASEYLNDGVVGSHPFCAGTSVSAGTHSVTVQFRHQGPFLGFKARQRKTDMTVMGAKR